MKQSRFPNLKGSTMCKDGKPCNELPESFEEYVAKHAQHLEEIRAENPPTMTTDEAHALLKETFKKLSDSNVIYTGLVVMPRTGDDHALVAGTFGTIAALEFPLFQALMQQSEEPDEEGSLWLRAVRKVALGAGNAGFSALSALLGIAARGARKRPDNA